MNKQLIAVFLFLSFTGCSKSTESLPHNTPVSSSTPVASEMKTTPQSQKGDRGTPDEAKAMLEKAIEHYNSAGRPTALSDFNAKNAPFGDRDLYVACIGPNDLIVANGGYPQLVGTSTNGWKDADGHPLGKATRDALGRGENSIRYRWLNPISNKIEPKIFFFQKVGDDICGVGAYNPEG
jgi:cytochrome c